MRSLLSLLDGAVRRSASQVTLESGQPVVYTTARGAEAESTVLPRTDLFEMIVAAVDDAQQVELAVGNPVEFLIDAGASWTVYAEPGMEGITVRARRGGVDSASLEVDSASLEIDVDYSVGAGVNQTHESADTLDPAAAAQPNDAVEFVDAVGPDEPHGGLGPDAETQPRRRDSSVEAIDVPSLDHSIGVDYGVTGPSPAPAAFESGTWALAEDEEFGGGLGSLGEGEEFGGGLGSLGEGDEFGTARSGALGKKAEESGPRGFAAGSPDAAGPAESPSTEPEGHIGVPDDDDDDDAAGFDPFPEPAPAPDLDRRRTLSPTVKAMSASPVPSSGHAVGAQQVAGMVTLPDFGSSAVAATAAQASTRREMKAMRSPEADTLRELPTFGRGESELNDVVADIGEGALVYVREPGLIDTLAQAFLSPSITIDDHADPIEVWSRMRGLSAGAIVIVRCEDPSRLLGWILRRLEEGYRVFVETRARTPQGARRVLLGVAATERAEQWLDSQMTLTLVPGEDGPQLVAS